MVYYIHIHESIHIYIEKAVHVYTVSRVLRSSKERQRWVPMERGRGIDCNFLFFFFWNKFFFLIAQFSTHFALIVKIDRTYANCTRANYSRHYRVRRIIDYYCTAFSRSYGNLFATKFIRHAVPRIDYSWREFRGPLTHAISINGWPV